MKSMLVSVATICTLLVGDGLQGAVPAEASGSRVVPVVDVPAPAFRGPNANRGGQAARIEYADGRYYAETSAWYRLAYVDGGTRLQVYDHYAASSTGPDSDMMRSETTAWQVANQVVAPKYRSATVEVPPWARVRTGNNTGPSAGLIFTLAYIDLLTPGALAGGLRVAGTGGIAVDGLAYAVSGIDVKIRTAMLTHPDVVFVTDRPSQLEHVTIIEAGSTRFMEVGDTIATTLALHSYEQAGRTAKADHGTAPVVIVHDLRQALAWLCGRADSASTCAIAHRSANVTIGGQAWSGAM
jgi:hypothetical protein